MEALRSESIARFPRLDGLPESRYDVGILGGGLAGLTLALQIKMARPQTSILVAEKREGPAPEAAFKVGESTVEAGARYYGEMLGLKDHIETRQLIKFGLRFYCPAGDNSDIARRVETGPPWHMPVHSYQLDRGRFENELMRRNLLAGVHAFDGCRVMSVELGLGGGDHRIVVERDDAEATVIAHWVIDATGRKATLKKQLDLAEDVEHNINSAWFRLEGGINIEDFTDDKDWLERIEVGIGNRMYATNHLMGDGYWVWLINLASGPISVGICADPRVHPFEEISTLDGALEWMRKHEPQVAAVVDSRGPEAIDDFLTVRDFSMGVKQVFSDQRWCLTGEAGAFLDPLISPGSDFIAYSNCLIADCLVRELNGEEISSRIRRFNDFYLLAFRSVLNTYTDSYGLLGNALVWAPKFITSAIMYWGTWSLMFFKGKMWDDAVIEAVWKDLQKIEKLYQRTSKLFVQWHELTKGQQWSDLWISPPNVGPLLDRIKDLAVDYDNDAFVKKLADNLRVYEAIAVVMFAKASELLPEPPDLEGRPISPYGISLDPSRWDPDGLLDGSGMTIEEATSMLPGIDHTFMDERVKVS